MDAANSAQSSHRNDTQQAAATNKEAAQANNSKTTQASAQSKPLSGLKTKVPAAFFYASRQSRMKEWREEKRLAEETARNTEFNTHIGNMKIKDSKR
ncbi:hypothetical protein VTI74DRAFT_10044 [Chaetomium olivicolor]